MFRFLEILNKNGYEAYLVGGIVRDYVLYKTDFSNLDGDIDITTNATPSRVEDVFSGHRIIETGIKHGTVTVLLDDLSAEITTYRTDGNYGDNRHPEKVAFVNTLKEDLARRDFTINALCFNPNEGLIDCFGGAKDLENKLIKAIGDPYKRFTEDSLRILRALRFASRLGFKIDRETSNAIHNLKHLLDNISSERIFSELKKILCGAYFKDIFLEYFDVFSQILPELSGMKNFDRKNFHHCHTLDVHTAIVVENVKPEPELRLAALFHDCGKPDTLSFDENGVGHFYSHATVSCEKAKNALRRLKSDNATVEIVTELIKYHDGVINEEKTAIKKRISKLGERKLRMLINLQRADTLGLCEEYKSRLEHFDVLNDIIERVLNEQPCFSLKDLKVNGNDAMNVGLYGKQISIALNEILNLVIEEKMENEREAQLQYLSSLI